MGSSWLNEAFSYVLKTSFKFIHSHFPCFLFVFIPFTISPDTLLLLVSRFAFAFVSVAQEKGVKQGQLGRERNADNILRDLKEIFTPSWELASPTEGNAVQLEQAVCPILVSFTS